MSAPKRKTKFAGIEADPDQFALIVNYNTETYYVDDLGNKIPGQSEIQPGQKVVKLKRGMQREEVPQMAHAAVENCKYIPSNKIGEVERLVAALVEHEQATQHQQNHGAPRHHQQDAPPQQRQEERPPKRKDPLLPPADIRKVEDYADQLYEDRMELKVLGAKCILRVCTEPPNLEIIGDHETLLGVLSRELREQSKKSFELAVAIVCTFLCFSHFSQFHVRLMQHQAGDCTLRVVEYESQRAQVRKEDMERRAMRLKELGDKATVDDKKLLVKDEKKYRIQLNRQNKLLHVCLMTLLNLAEEIAIEKKMVNRKMPTLLAAMLDRQHEELVLVVLQFLKKLTVFEENKDAVNTPQTLSLLAGLCEHHNVRIALLAMRVLHNLSFDEKVRAALVESNITSLLVNQLRNPPFRHIVLQLLYHFSMDDRCKSLLAYHRDGMIMLLQLVVHFPEPRVGKDLVALVVNLSTHPRAAEAMIASGLFPQIMLRTLKTRDPLLCKVLRHVTSHKDILEPTDDSLFNDPVQLSKFLHEMVRMALCCVDNPDLLVEVLGILSNMTMPEVPWGELCEAGLLDLLTRLLVPSLSEDDIVLECVMLISNLALNREAANHFIGSRLPSMMQDLLTEKRDDEEIVVQLLFAFQCLLIHEEVRDFVLNETELAPCVMRFSRAKNSMVLEQATRLLQLVAEYAGDADQDIDAPSWIEQIKEFRFQQHNAEWTRFVERDMQGGGGMSPGGGYYYDDDRGDYRGEEEEFAFHWAGGDVGDMNDIARRDWGSMDYQDQSRFVS